MCVIHPPTHYFALFLINMQTLQSNCSFNY